MFQFILFRKKPRLITFKVYYYAFDLEISQINTLIIFRSHFPLLSEAAEFLDSNIFSDQLAHFLYMEAPNGKIIRGSKLYKGEKIYMGRVADMRVHKVQRKQFKFGDLSNV